MSNENYKLTDQEFNECIKNFFKDLSTKSNCEKNGDNIKKMEDISPSITYIIGQAGAGKTVLRRYILEKFNEDGKDVVELDADKLAKYHKHYKKILHLAPDDFYKSTREFVQPANKIVQELLIKKRINIIKEKVMHRGDVDYDELAEFINAGYNIDINVLAVDKYESFLSCLERESLSIKNGEIPRRVTKKDHDRMYNNFSEELQEIIRRKLFDNISIYGREKDSKTNRKISSFNAKENIEDILKNVIKCIDIERNNSYKRLFSERNNFFDRISKVKKDIEIYLKNDEIRKNYNDEIDSLKIDSSLKYDRDDR